MQQYAQPQPATRAQDRMRQLHPGEVLFRAGDQPGPMFLIRSGCVRVLSAERDLQGNVVELARLRAGSLVGELSSLLNQPRNATVEAIMLTTVEALSPAQVRILVSKSEDFAKIVAKAATERANMPSGELVERARQNQFELPETPATMASVQTQGRALPRPEFDKTRASAMETQCPLCRTAFFALMPKQSADAAVSTDSDFFKRYKPGRSQYDYAIRVCPNCLYAATHTEFKTLEEPNFAAMRQAIDEVVIERFSEERPDFSQDRNLGLRRASFHLALGCYRARGADPAKLGAILQNLAWCAREEDNESEERFWLIETREAYRSELDRTGSASAKDLIRLQYLVGELSMRLGEPQEAFNAFSDSLRMPELRTMAAWERMVRDRREDAREALKVAGAPLEETEGAPAGATSP